MLDEKETPKTKITTCDYDYYEVRERGTWSHYTFIKDFGRRWTMD